MSEPSPEVTVSNLAASRRLSGITWILVALVILALIVGGWLGNQQIQELRADADIRAQLNAKQDEAINGLTRDSLALRQELEQRGVNPDTIAPPPEDRTDNIPSVPGPPGEPGEPGEPGRGIVKTALNDGVLSVFYTDGDSETLGSVKGTPGPEGRGVASTAIKDGALVVNFTDGTSREVGEVVGPGGTTGPKGDPGSPGEPGRGVAALTITDGILFVSYTDGTSAEVGPLPVGPAGPSGPAGRGITSVTCSTTLPPKFTLTITYTDGTTETVSCEPASEPAITN